MAHFSVARDVDAPPSLVCSLFRDFAHAPKRVTELTSLDLGARPGSASR